MYTWFCFGDDASEDITENDPPLSGPTHRTDIRLIAHPPFHYPPPYRLAQLSFDDYGSRFTSAGILGKKSGRLPPTHHSVSRAFVAEMLRLDDRAGGAIHDEFW